MKRISFKQQIEEARTVQLSKDEKAMIRAALLTYMSTHNPARSYQAVSSEWRVTLSSFTSRVFSIRSTVGMAAAFFFVLFGVASAAENALPGNPLYTIKVNINEKVLGVIAANAQAETELQGKLATRRLKEAEELALRGKLDTEHQVAIEKRFKVHTEKAKAEIVRIKEEDGPAAAADASLQVEASLAVHGKILVSIGTQSGPEVQSALFPLVGTVQSETGIITDERVESESDITINANSETAHEKESLAQKNITEARKIVREKLLDADIRAEVEELIGQADSALWGGRDRLDKKDYGAAVLLFQKSSWFSQQALEFADTEHELDMGIPITPDVGTSTESSEVLDGNSSLESPNSEADVGEQLENAIP